MHYPVVGHKFRGKTQADVVELKPEAEVTLVREPENEYDQNAIRVMINGEHWGYIPRAMNEHLAQLMDLGETFEAKIASIDAYANPAIYLAVEAPKAPAERGAKNG